jgi:hypothetical protein
LASWQRHSVEIRDLWLIQFGVDREVAASRMISQIKDGKIFGSSQETLSQKRVTERIS